MSWASVRTSARSLLPARTDYAHVRRTWRGDLLAGLTVGIVALPLALGFGVSSGLSAEAGLITAVVAQSDVAGARELLDELPGEPRMIFTTHQHYDHWKALADVAKATGAPTAAGRVDAPELPVAPDILLDDGDVLTVGDLTFDAAKPDLDAIATAGLAFEPLDVNGSLALEPVSHATDAFNLAARGVAGVDMRTLAPGQSLAGTMRVSLGGQW